MQTRIRHILCVDQDGKACALIGALLGESGFEAKNATTLTEALQLARSERFDLYLLERRLPDGSGIELCRQIREFDPHSPVLFFSAIARKRDRQRAVSAGAQGYLHKPEGIYSLAKVVTRLR